ncbi:MAG: acetyl-CoA carboxylase biotin carboxyl carrier protein [Gammaproteobacteria bacterium]
MELLEESGLSEIEITEGDDKVRISKQTTVAKSTSDNEIIYVNDTNKGFEESASSAPLPKNGFHEVKAPMIGTYYQASEPNAEAFVKVGDPVSEGDTLCIIEAMKMMNKIECDIGGIVERILVQNGDPVEYDETLFLISKN